MRPEGLSAWNTKQSDRGTSHVEGSKAGMLLATPFADRETAL